MAMDGADCVSFGVSGRIAAVKWHCLRRHANDPFCSRKRLSEGLRNGASMEVDLRLTRDGHFVCLHDADLDRETTGRGLLAGMDLSALGDLRMLNRDGRPGDEPPLSLMDIAAHWPDSCHPRALLQFDLKEPASALLPESLDRFSALVAPIAGHCVVSGNDADAVARLAAAVPGIRTGHDPEAWLTVRDVESAEATEAAVRRILAEAPDARWIYLDKAVAKASLAASTGLVAMLRANGRSIDVWTFDPATDGDVELAVALARLGVEQLTSVDPAALCRLASRED